MPQALTLLKVDIKAFPRILCDKFQSVKFSKNFADLVTTSSAASVRDPIFITDFGVQAEGAIMLHKGRIEIQGTGPFSVFFWSDSREPWTTKKICFYEAEDTIMFLVDSLLLPPEKVGRMLLDAIANGWGVSQEVALSDQQLESVFGAILYVVSTRLAS